MFKLIYKFSYMLKIIKCFFKGLFIQNNKIFDFKLLLMNSKKIGNSPRPNPIKI